MRRSQNGGGRCLMGAGRLQVCVDASGGGGAPRPAEQSPVSTDEPLTACAAAPDETAICNPGRPRIDPVLEEIDGFHEQSLEPCDTVGFERDRLQSLKPFQKASR